MTGDKQPRPQPIRPISLMIGQGGDLSLMSAMNQTPASRGRIGMENRQGSEWQWVHNFDDAQQFAQTHYLRAVAGDSEICSEHDHIVDARGRAVPIRPASTELERMLGRASVRHGSGGATSDIDASATRRYEVAKRILDLLVSTTLLTIAAIPVILLYVLFCLCFGPSTVVSSRTVVGHNGAPFTCRQLSFVPTRLALGTRRGRAAAYVRAAMNRTHLNLLATLTNVLADDMSLVGPRAVDINGIKMGTEISCAYPQRFAVKPGLVSLARVRFRYSDSPRDIRLALEYDLYYIKYRSLKLDFRVLGRGFILVEIDVLKTLALTFAVGGRLVVRDLHRLTGNTAFRPSRIASVAMPTGEGGQTLDLKPTLIIGAGQGGKLIASELQRDHNSGLWPVAFVDDDPSLLGGRVRGIPVLGNTSVIAAVASREHIETIILAIPSASELELQRIADAARDTGIPMLTMPSIGNILRGDDATRLRAVETSDLLGRPVVETDAIRARAFLGGKRVLVTGAAGSIGREVVRQALRGEPDTIYGLDINESDLYDLQQELKATATNTRFIPIVASVTQPSRLNNLMTQMEPQVVFHAAAYKHVPLMEDFPHEAVQSNIQGTWNVAQAAARVNAERFVLVSTDKAVRPSSVMGASKRIAELVVRDIANATGLSACAVRFGNVLGSRGSVIPLFERQIAAGGPVTITDKRMTRYFMTIPEAAGLIIEAGAFGDSGVIYMLDMGEPVRIVDVADRLIRLHGKRPGSDIEITYTGLRPGEKLFEELALDFETARATGHSKIRILEEGAVTQRQSAELMMQRLLQVIQNGSPEQIRVAIMRNVRLADEVETSVLTPMSSIGHSATA